MAVVGKARVVPGPGVGRRTVPRAAALFGAVSLVTLAAAGAPAERSPAAPGLRLVPLLDGLRAAARDGDPRTVGALEVGRLAERAGVDLTRPPHPLVAHRHSGNRLFYAFFDTLEGAFGARPYVVQRVRRTERVWRTPDAVADTSVAYLVEAFRTFGGELVRPDQHHGSFALRGAHRREIVKEYEVGFGTVPGVLDGAQWPYGDAAHREVQPWRREPSLHDAVRFAASRRWTLAVGLSASGAHHVRCPELGLDLPRALPDLALSRPRPNPSSAGLVLSPGRGIGALRFGRSRPADLVLVLGEPLEDRRDAAGRRRLSFARGLTARLDAEGRLDALLTHGDFAGRTDRGVAHGWTREEALAALGPPVGRPEAALFAYPGLSLHFDALGRVRRIVVRRRGGRNRTRREG